MLKGSLYVRAGMLGEPFGRMEKIVMADELVSLNLRRITYRDLNARQKENYNYQKISGILADYGFITHRLSDDWHGADFIAQHITGDQFVKVQLKGRFSLKREYIGKNLYVAFFVEGSCYLFPHDELLVKLFPKTTIETTSSWMDYGSYTYPRMTHQLKQLLADYKIF